MQFAIGPHAVTLRITHRLPADQLGAAVFASQEVLISARVAAPLRLAVLLHELRHCWDWWVPRAKGEEEEAQLYATMAKAAMADLQRQGGEDALRSMSPADEPLTLRTVEPCEDDAGPTHDVTAAGSRALASIHSDGGLRFVPCQEDGAEREAGAGDSGRFGVPRAEVIVCTRCQVRLPGALTVQDPPVFSLPHRGVLIHRRIYCPRCHHLQVWAEGELYPGVPNGQCVHGPAHVRGQAVDKFLAEHPQAVAAGVE